MGREEAKGSPGRAGRKGGEGLEVIPDGKQNIRRNEEEKTQAELSEIIFLGGRRLQKFLVKICSHCLPGASFQ